MKVLNLLTSGSFGGIEVYCKNIGISADYENGFCFLFGEGGIFDLMKKKKLTVFSLVEKRKFTFLRFKMLKQLAYKYDVIVVHHEDPYLRLYFLFLKLCYPNKKFVLMLHSCFENYRFEQYGVIKRFLANLVLRYVIKKCDSVISVSNAVKSSYLKFLKFYESKSITIYNGISEYIISKGKSSKFIVNNPIKLLYVGRLSREKGIDILINAVSKLDVDFELKLVGDGSERNFLESLVREKKLEKKVFFEGFQSDVGMYLEECNIFILPTLWESFGISIVESMAFGRICISNAVGGIPEIISNNKNGYLCDNLTAENLCKTIEFACKNILLSGQMRAHAQETASFFSIKNSCNNLKIHFQSLLDE